MRVVVTGATGNVGTAVLRALGADDAVDSIVGIARRLPKQTPAKVEWHAADVAHDTLTAVFAGADCVVHLAWLIQPARDRNVTWLANVHGSRRVFAAVAEAAVPALVYASSVGAYSTGPKNTSVDESWPTDGIRTSFYSRDKAEVERILDDWESANPNVRVVRLRPSVIVQWAMGAAAKRLFTGPLVPRRLVNRRTIPFVPDTPGLRIQLTHADDVAEAYRLAVVGDARGAFNLSADPVLDPDELSRLLGRPKLPVPARLLRMLVAASWQAHLQPTPEGWLDMALQTPLLDAGRARRELGWRARHSAGDALLEVLDGFSQGAGAPTPPLAPT